MNFEKDLLDLLKTNWALAAPLDTANIVFTRSYKPEELRERGEWKPIVAVAGYAYDQRELVGPEPAQEGWARIRTHIVLWAATRKDSDIETVKDDRDSMVEEIDRILKSATLPSGWRAGYVSSGRGREDLDISPPRVEEELEVEVLYYR